MKKGFMVVFEGIAGAGKKTHVRLLAERLQAEGKKVTIMSFPNYEVEIARLTKRITFDPFTQALLYAADRAYSQEKLKILLEEGNIVISDRYCYSNFAYQSAVGVPLEWLIEIEKNIIKPNLVFLIDVPVEISIKRIQQASIEDFTKREILDRLQKEKEVLEKVRNTYLLIAAQNKEAKWFVIDGTKSIRETSEEILTKVKEELKL